jgi:hypothetical protein
MRRGRTDDNPNENESVDKKARLDDVRLYLQKITALLELTIAARMQQKQSRIITKALK